MTNTMPDGEQMQALAKRFNDHAHSKGFYDGVAIDNNWRKRQRLLIAGEVGEAYEAMRCGKIQPTIALTLADVASIKQNPDIYKPYKGTVAEELADVVIRCYDYMGEVDNPLPLPIDFLNDLIDGVSVMPDGATLEDLFFAAYHAVLSSPYNFEVDGICLAYQIADRMGIDLNLQIELKAAYNTTRPYKHNKNY